MKILVISGILPLPGVDRSNDFLIELYSAYRKKYPDDEISFIRPTDTRALFKWNKNNAQDEFCIKDFHIKILPYFSIWRFPVIHTYVASGTLILFNKRKIRNYINTVRPDIIQAEYIVPDGFLAYYIKRLFEIPFLITTHNEYRYFDHTSSRLRILKMLHKACFVTPLNYVSKETMRKYEIKKCLIIPLGVDERFLNAKRLPADGPEIRVLSIGVLIALKNFDKVLQALASLKGKYNFIYTIAGDGPEMGKLTKLADDLGIKEKVVFKGLVDYNDIPSEMAKHDIFIMPSYFESFGRVFFEAMAVGLPVICAKNTGIFGYFSDGVEGLSVDHRSVKDIEEKLLLLFQNSSLRDEMGQKGRMLVQRFTWDNIVAEFRDLYQKSLKGCN